MFIAYEQLKKAMHEDAAYAWSWHCNLAVPIMDSLKCSHEDANKAAAHLMQHLFALDITQSEYWKFEPTARAMFADSAEGATNDR